MKLTNVGTTLKTAVSDEEKYSDEDYKKDILVVKTQTAVNIVKLYGPSVALGIASVYG